MQTPPDSSETSAQSYIRWMNTAISHHRAGRSEESLLAYRQALRHNPRDDFAFACLADVLNNLGRYEEALVAWRCAIELNSNCVLAYFSKVEAQMTLHLYEEAIKTCEP